MLDEGSVGQPLASGESIRSHSHPGGDPRPGSMVENFVGNSWGSAVAAHPPAVHLPRSGLPGKGHLVISQWVPRVSMCALLLVMVAAKGLGGRSVR